MFGFNSPSALRMLQHLQASHQPAHHAEVEQERPIRQTKSRGRRAPSPPPETDSDYTSDSSNSTSSYSGSSSSYESDPDVIYSHVVEKKKCAYVSPAGLKSKSSSGREAIEHLKKKNCPEVSELKKSKRKSHAAPATPAPAPPAPAASAPPAQSAAPKRSRKVAPAPEPAPAPAPAPAAPAAKTKRAPSAYNEFMREHLKAGKSMVEISKMWKEKKGA